MSLYNNYLIAGVNKVYKPIVMKINVGTRVIKDQVTVEGFDKRVWYDPETYVNIIGINDAKGSIKSYIWLCSGRCIKHTYQ